MATREEVSKYGEMDAELKQLLSSITLPPRPDLNDVAARRAFSSRLEAANVAALGTPSAKVKESYSTIATRDGHQHKCKVFQPTRPPAKGCPLIVLFFGGGFNVGSPEQTTSSGRALTETFGAVCIAPGYRLTPEIAFPTPVEDGWDALKYIAPNAGTFNATPSAGFIVGGASAGGNIAAVLTQLAKDQPLTHPLTGQYLSIPITLDASIVPSNYRDIFFSREQRAEAPVFDKLALDSMFDRYKAEFKSPLFSPINSKSGQTGLPPTYFQVCGMDPIRDDGLIYEKILKEQGVCTRLDVYSGLPHGFWLFFPVLSTALKAKADMVKGVGWLLGVDVDDATAEAPFKTGK